MKANRSFRFFGLLALATLATSLTSAFAKAQAFKGNFTLPFQASWKGLVLPAGNYSFSIDRLAAQCLIVVQREGKTMGLVVVGPVFYNSPSGQSELVAAPGAAMYRIKALRLQNVCTIEFQAPESKRPRSNRENELSLVVPITGDKA